MKSMRQTVCMRQGEPGRWVGYQNISEVSPSVVRRRGACTDSSFRPEVSYQLYSLFTTGILHKSNRDHSEEGQN